MLCKIRKLMREILFVVIKLYSYQIIVQMESMILQGKSKRDLELLVTLAKKIGLKTKFIDNEYMEDIALANAMKKGRTGKFVDTAKYVAKLKS